MDFIREKCGLPTFEPGAGRDKYPRPRFQDRPNERIEEISRLQRMAANAAAAARIWAESLPPEGTPVESYLYRRGLYLPPEAAGRTLRYHPNCPWKDGARVPALVARFAPIENDLEPEALPTAIHRIRLDMLAGRDRKLSLGSTKGQVVKLSPDEDISYGLHLCEGIETGVALMARDWRPLWACCAEGTLRLFPVLDGIETLTIGADHDQAGLIAAQVCAERWVAGGKEVLIRWPDGLGDDYADEARP
jgi:hypothetical protein